MSILFVLAAVAGIKTTPMPPLAPEKTTRAGYFQCLGHAYTSHHLLESRYVLTQRGVSPNGQVEVWVNPHNNFVILNIPADKPDQACFLLTGTNLTSTKI